MASPRILLHLYRLLQQRRAAAAKAGFTLLELLISIAIAGIIVSGLLYLVVEVLQIDTREAALNQTQQNIDRAMDYISRDLSEAVLVFPDGPDLQAMVDKLTDEPAGKPIVGFWRVDPVEVPDSLNCATVATAKQQECETLRIRHSSYTLVVYFLAENGANDIWSGDARIIRYELPKYSNVANLTQRTGYSEPAPDKFESDQWNRTGTTTDGTSAVLTDSVAAPGENPGTLPNDCSNAGNDYARIPTNADAAATNTTGTSYSFFVCIRDAADENISALNLNEGETARSNQDLVVYLRGDATDNRPVFAIASENSRLPTQERRVLVRGILEKRPRAD